MMKYKIHFLIIILTFFFTARASEYGTTAKKSVSLVEHSIIQYEKIMCQQDYAAYKKAQQNFFEGKIALCLNQLDHLVEKNLTPAMHLRGELAHLAQDFVYAQRLINHCILNNYLPSYSFAALIPLLNIPTFQIDQNTVFEMPYCNNAARSLLLEHPLMMYVMKKPVTITNLRNIYPIYRLVKPSIARTDNSLHDDLGKNVKLQFKKPNPEPNVTPADKHSSLQNNKQQPQIAVTSTISYADVAKKNLSYNTKLNQINNQPVMQLHQPTQAISFTQPKTVVSVAPDKSTHRTKDIKKKLDNHVIVKSEEKKERKSKKNETKTNTSSQETVEKKEEPIQDKSEKKQLESLLSASEYAEELLNRPKSKLSRNDKQILKNKISQQTGSVQKLINTYSQPEVSFNARLHLLKFLLEENSTTPAINRLFEDNEKTIDQPSLKIIFHKDLFTKISQLTQEYAPIKAVYATFILQAVLEEKVHPSFITKEEEIIWCIKHLENVPTIKNRELRDFWYEKLVLLYINSDRKTEAFDLCTKLISENHASLTIKDVYNYLVVIKKYNGDPALVLQFSQELQQSPSHKNQEKHERNKQFILEMHKDNKLPDLLWLMIMETADSSTPEGFEITKTFKNPCFDREAIKQQLSESAATKLLFLIGQTDHKLGLHEEARSYFDLCQGILFDIGTIAYYFERIQQKFHHEKDQHVKSSNLLHNEEWQSVKTALQTLASISKQEISDPFVRESLQWLSIIIITYHQEILSCHEQIIFDLFPLIKKLFQLSKTENLNLLNAEQILNTLISFLEKNSTAVNMNQKDAYTALLDDIDSIIPMIQESIEKRSDEKLLFAAFLFTLAKHQSAHEKKEHYFAQALHTTLCLLESDLNQKDQKELEKDIFKKIIDKWLLITSHPEEHRKHIDRFLKLYPEDPYALYAKAWILSKLDHQANQGPRPISSLALKLLKKSAALGHETAMVELFVIEEKPKKKRELAYALIENFHNNIGFEYIIQQMKKEPKKKWKYSYSELQAILFKQKPENSNSLTLKMSGDLSFIIAEQNEQPMRASFFQEAFLCYQQAVEKMPGYHEVWFRLAIMALHGNGCPQNTDMSYDYFMNIDPSEYQPPLSLNDFKEACKIIETSPGDELKKHLLLAYLIYYASKQDEMMWEREQTQKIFNWLESVNKSGLEPEILLRVYAILITLKLSIKNKSACEKYLVNMMRVLSLKKKAHKCPATALIEIEWQNIWNKAGLIEIFYKDDPRIQSLVKLLSPMM